MLPNKRLGIRFVPALDRAIGWQEDQIAIPVGLAKLLFPLVIPIHQDVFHLQSHLVEDWSERVTVFLLGPGILGQHDQPPRVRIVLLEDFDGLADRQDLQHAGHAGRRQTVRLASPIHAAEYARDGSGLEMLRHHVLHCVVVGGNDDIGLDLPDEIQGFRRFVRRRLRMTLRIHEEGGQSHAGTRQRILNPGHHVIAGAIAGVVGIDVDHIGQLLSLTAARRQQRDHDTVQHASHYRVSLIRFTISRAWGPNRLKTAS